MTTLTTTGVYEQLAEAWLGKKRHIWVEGGTAASKTYSILQMLILIAQNIKSPLLISIVSESVPHLKRGVLRDFENILGDTYNPSRFNRTDMVYTFGEGVIEFFSADEPSKLRGGRRDVLFVNEANNIPYDAFRELDSRTRRCTIADWNPTSEFFYHQHYLPLDSTDAAYIHATYKDALNVVPKEVIENILAMGAMDPNWERVYIEGLLGNLQGLILPRFDIVDTVPKEVTAWAYGLDFGYVHPTALTKVALVEAETYLDEAIYKTKLTNADLIELLRHEELADIYADSAEPQRIEEIARAGFRVYPANKDVKYGLDLLKRTRLHITKRSTNLLKEIRGYQYKKDKDGKLTEEPIKLFDDGVDAARYGVVGVAQRVGLATKRPSRSTGPVLLMSKPRGW